MKFNSQICTSHSQSERLLALGLKKDTADMVHQPIGVSPYKVWGNAEISDDFCPAWSLHRLIEIVPKLVKVPKPNYGWNGEDLMFHINDELHILYEDLCIENEEYRFCSKYFYKSNLYDNFIDCIEWLIKEGYFNKEYLEE